MKLFINGTKTRIKIETRSKLLEYAIIWIKALWFFSLYVVIVCSLGSLRSSKNLYPFLPINIHRSKAEQNKINTKSCNGCVYFYFVALELEVICLNC